MLASSGIASAQVSFTPSFSTNGSPSALTDFNGDGQRDLAVVEQDASPAAASIFLGDGQGGFSNAGRVGLGVPFAADLAAVRVSGDAAADLAAVYNTDFFGNGLSVVPGDGQGGFGAPSVVSPDGFPDALAGGDFNDDGHDDLVVSGGTVCVGASPPDCDTTETPIYNGGSLPLQAGGSVPALPGTRRFTPADLDGDGRLDLVAVNGGDVLVFKRAPLSNAFTAGVSYPVGIRPSGVAVGDLTGDGNIDLAVSDADGAAVWILPGDGTGAFGDGQSFVVESPTGAIAVADLTADGLADVAAGREGPSRVAVLVGEGGGQLAAPISFALSGDPSESPKTLVARDVTGDGAPDLVATTFGSVTVLRNGAGGPPEDLDALLTRYAPELRYDVSETYRADSAATLTDNHVPGSHSNALTRESGENLAVSNPADPAPDLSLSFLGLVQYESGAVVTDGDYIDAANLQRVNPLVSLPAYETDAQRLHSQGQYSNRIYGRVVSYPDGRRVLQYWMFYYYNPKRFGFLIEARNHEGDWEMMQVELDSTGTPQHATYAQHGHPQRCEWDAVDKSASEGPVVYVAEGSHASYFTAGTHVVPVDSLPDVTDTAGGDGERVMPTVENVTASPSWLVWPGRWGGSSGVPGLGTTGASPVSPSRQAPWADPLAWGADAEPCGGTAGASQTRAPAPPETVSATRETGVAHIRYRLSDRGLVPYLVLTSVDDPDDALVPITVATLARGPAGNVVQPLGEGRPTVATVIVVSKDGRRSPPVRVPLR